MYGVSPGQWPMVVCFSIIACSFLVLLERRYAGWPPTRRRRPRVLLKVTRYATQIVRYPLKPLVCNDFCGWLAGSTPASRTSSEIPATVPFPASPKTALWREFLRFHPRPAALGSRVGQAARRAAGIRAAPGSFLSTYFMLDKACA